MGVRLKQFFECLIHGTHTVICCCIHENSL
jgi:hypothetical protein